MNGSGAAGPDPARLQAVDRAREGWIRRLIDLSRRNNLLYYRDLKTGTCDLAGAAPAALASLIAGEKVDLGDLLPGEEEQRASARVREIRRRALANREERGLETLFLAMGMASWPAADGGRPAQSAVLLVPVAVESRGREERSLALRRSGEIAVNPVLLHVLESEHGCRVDADKILGNHDGNGQAEEACDPAAACARLATAAAAVKGFAVEARSVLGNFSFQKMAMVNDLRTRGMEMAAHDLIAAIAGDAAARAALGESHAEIDPREFDAIPPENEHLILDADASQQRVIAGVLGRQDGVIQGPPGTGKSQTITNLITALAAQGRRALFVAEKRAALEVVLRRLKAAGLGHLALDLHGADVSRRDVMKKIASDLDLVRESLPVEADELHRRFAERRSRLNAHVERLHAPRPPSGRSVYEMQGRLLRLPPEARTAARWRGPDLDRLDAGAAGRARDLLAEAGGFEGLFLRTDPSPWTGAGLSGGPTAEHAIDLTSRLAGDGFDAFRNAAATVVARCGLMEPVRFADVKRLSLLLDEISEMLALYDPDLFGEDLEAVALALAPAGRGFFARLWAVCCKPAYRRARSIARGRRTAGPVASGPLLAEIRKAAEQLRRLRELALPGARSAAEVARAVPGLGSERERLRAFAAGFEELASLLVRPDPGSLALDQARRLVDGLAADTVTPHRIPRLLEIEAQLAEAGAGALADEIRKRQPPASQWPLIFEHAWLSSCLDRVRAEDPAVGGFNGRTHEQIVREFCRLDRERLKVAVDRVRRAHAERVIATMNAHPEQDALVRREAAKKTRHLPLRKLLAEAPDVLTALYPCWMASPLAVSQLLDADRRYFDAVLFDEASQVLPEDAVPALLRASQAVVAGDRHQLPPTIFFAAGDDDAEESAAATPSEGFESLLDLMSFLGTPWTLDWHYRSRDEALIAFSNHHIYGGRLVTFPGPGGEGSVGHVLVERPEAEAQDGQDESVSSEVRRVVELVIEHATARPGETLGVIALGILHAERIEGALDAALRARPDLDPFFDQERDERFFVKNLERVQGDERDAIILSVGCGKDGAGKLDYRSFGPLNAEGGERRLNVAITRARGRMTVVSSFDHRDMDPNRSRARGVEMLRLYLEYAASGGRSLAGSVSTGVPLNAFEQDVFDALTARELRLVPQMGASRYRIDLVAQHPKQPGRFVLAIECDGASYHAAPTARDRDRLRQQHLEALGWRFHRIWSTDWFLRRDDEIERTVAAYEAAATPAPAAVRGPRPRVPRRDSIDDYSRAEVTALVEWIESDGRLRTDDEIVEEMVDTLGFRRRGGRIESAVRAAIARVRTG